jgi:hypothetical protein
MHPCSPRTGACSPAIARVLGPALLVLASCQAAVSDAELRSAPLYFPPNFKYVAEPRPGFTAAERQRALLEAKAQGVDTVFELVIDSEGRVRRARLLRTHHPARHHELLLEHARGFEFEQDAQSELYRAFYYPTNYELNLSFEWL